MPDTEPLIDVDDMILLCHEILERSLQLVLGPA